MLDRKVWSKLRAIIMCCHLLNWRINLSMYNGDLGEKIIRCQPEAATQTTLSRFPKALLVASSSQESMGFWVYSSSVQHFHCKYLKWSMFDYSSEGNVIDNKGWMQSAMVFTWSPTEKDFYGCCHRRVTKADGYHWLGLSKRWMVTSRILLGQFIWTEFSVAYALSAWTYPMTLYLIHDFHQLKVSAISSCWGDSTSKA